MRIPPEIPKRWEFPTKSHKNSPPSGKAFKSESMNGHFFRICVSRHSQYAIFIDVGGKIPDEDHDWGTIICALLFTPYFYA